MISTIHLYRNVTLCQLQLSACFIIPYWCICFIQPFFNVPKWYICLAWWALTNSVLFIPCIIRVVSFLHFQQTNAHSCLIHRSIFKTLIKTLIKKIHKNIVMNLRTVMCICWLKCGKKCRSCCILTWRAITVNWAGKLYEQLSWKLRPLKLEWMDYGRQEYVHLIPVFSDSMYQPAETPKDLSKMHWIFKMWHVYQRPWLHPLLNP